MNEKIFTQKFGEDFVLNDECYADWVVGGMCDKELIVRILTLTVDMNNC